MNVGDDTDVNYVVPILHIEVNTFTPPEPQSNLTLLGAGRPLMELLGAVDSRFPPVNVLNKICEYTYFCPLFRAFAFVGETLPIYTLSNSTTTRRPEKCVLSYLHVDASDSLLDLNT